MKKIRHSFGTVYNSMTDEKFVEVDDVAEALSKNWGDIPKYLNDTKAFEIHCLAKAYNTLQRRIAAYEKSCRHPLNKSS